MQSNSSSALPKIIGVIVAILVCCSCIAIAAVGAFLYRSYQNTPFNISTPFAPFENTVTPVYTNTANSSLSSLPTSEMNNKNQIYNNKYSSSNISVSQQLKYYSSSSSSSLKSISNLRHQLIRVIQIQL